MSEQEVERAARRYHVDRGHRRFETQRQAIERADRRVDDGTRGSQLLGPFAPILKRLHEDAATVLYDHRLPGEVDILKQGLEMRAAPVFEPHDYEAYSHPQLHEMVTRGVDPGAVGEMGDTWLKIGNALTSFQDDVARTLARSETTWQGAAGDRARQAVASLGNRGAQAGQAAQLAGIVMHQQSAALATAKNSMPPPPSQPFDAGAAARELQTTTDPIRFATQAAADQRAFSHQKAAHQEAARVVKEYDTTVAQTSRNMPSFAPTPSSVQPATDAGRQLAPAAPSSPSVVLPVHQQNLPASRPDGFAHTSTSDSLGDPRDGGTRLSGSPVAGGGPLSGDGGSPGGSGLPLAGAGGRLTSDGDSSGRGGGLLTGGSLSGSLNGGGGPVTPGGFPLDGGGGSPEGGRLAGSRRDAARAGFGEFAAGGGEGTRVGPGVGAGSRSGVRSGVGASVGEVERGSTGVRPAAGAAGIPPAARGRRAEDTEHKRPVYLREPDTDGIFGSDERTAPPVIG